MRADGSAYAALGLEPDADLGDIERAYKRLIKRYHPDRQGGDAERAASITRAYHELRGRPDPEHALEFHDDEAIDRDGRGWVVAAMLLIFGIAALIIGTGPLTALVHRLSPAAPRISDHSAVMPGASEAMDQPIKQVTITEAVRDALRLTREHDDARLIGVSRECQRKLRAEPSVERLDRCAAFDDAVLQIQNHDAMWDRGPFSQSEVTTRQWSSASALSNDYLAVDGRLDRIRLAVELALAPPEPVQPAPPSD